MGDQSADTVVVNCACEHSKDDHFRGTGNCMFSTEGETWACDCPEYRPLGIPQGLIDYLLDPGEQIDGSGGES